MFVLVFAARSAPEEPIGKSVCEKHPMAEISLLLVKNATPQQLLEALKDRQPDAVYFAECTDAGEVSLIDVAKGQLRPRTDPHVRHPDPILVKIAAAVQSRLGTPDLTDPDGRPTRSSMRKLLDRCLPNFASFETFIEKQFHEVAMRVTPSMNRMAQTNVLFSICQTRDILDKLADLPELEPNRHLLNYELYSSRFWRAQTGQEKS